MSRIADITPLSASSLRPRASAHCTRARRSSSRTPGTPARPGCSRRSASRRSPPRAPASRSPSGAATAGSRSTRWSSTSARSRGDGPAGLGRPRERLRPDARGAARGDRRAAEAGAVGGSIEDWDPGGRALRARPRGRARRRGAQAARAPRLPVHAHRPRREPHPRQPRPRRHDRAPAGLRARPAPTCSTRPGLRSAEEIRAVCDASSSRSTCSRIRGSRCARSSRRARSGSASAARSTWVGRRCDRRGGRADSATSGDFSVLAASAPKEIF